MSAAPDIGKLGNAALEVARKGFAVFPCVPLGKEPATTNGHKDATTEENVIRTWWAQNPHYNIGVSPGHSGMFVLDRDGPRGAETLATLELEHGFLPTTLTFQTPRGADHLHYWFKGRCPSSVGTDKRGLGPKLDTRGYGGYVLLPPSRVRYENGHEGEYTCTDDRDIADAPAWIPQVVNAKHGHHEAATDVELDTEPNIARAIKRAKEWPEVSIGEGSDAAAYRNLGELHDLGLSILKGAAIAYEHWGKRCRFDRKWIETKARNIGAYAQNEAGCSAVAPGAETFAHIAASQPEQPAKRFKHGFTRAESRLRPPPSWLAEGLLQERTHVMAFAPTSFLKSFVATDIACCTAYGLPVFGNVPVLGKPGPVFYCAAEGTRDFEKRRITAWEIAHGFEPYSASRIFLADHGPLLGIPEMAVEFVEDAKELLKDFPGERFRLFVVDTYHTTLNGNNEDASTTPGLHLDALKFIQRELGCTTLTIHHTGKNAEREERGSYALRAGMDTVLQITEHTQNAAKVHTLKLVVRKQRGWEDGQSFALQSQRVETPDGPSLALVQVSEAEAAKELQRGQGKAAKGSALKELAGEVTAALAALGAYPGAPHARDTKAMQGGISTDVLAAKIVDARWADKLAGTGIEMNDEDRIAHASELRKVTLQLQRYSKEADPQEGRQEGVLHQFTAGWMSNASNAPRAWALRSALQEATDA